MEEKRVDYVVVPVGLMVLLIYHGWLLFAVLRNPRRTVIGLNAESRHQWVLSLMAVRIDNHLPIPSSSSSLALRRDFQCSWALSDCLLID